MSDIISNPGGYLLSGSGTGVAITGSPADCRACQNFAYLEYASYSVGDPDLTGKPRR